MTFDVKRVRAAYPALNDGFAYLDGAAGTQVPATVIDAITDAYRAGLGNVGGAFPASGRSGSIVAECRQALADLTGASPDGVILGPNMTTLTYRLAEALSRRWERGDEIVVSRLDHDANIRPWVQAAARRGATVRWAEVDLATTELPAGQYSELLSERTRLVAVTAASNVVGTRPDLAAIAAAAHAVGALVYVDGVHATPHVPGGRRGARRRLLRHQRLQMVRPAHRHRGRRSGPARQPAPGQARARARGACPAGSSAAPPPSPTWPGSSPRWSTWPRSATARIWSSRPGGSGCWPRWPTVEEYETQLFAGLLDGLDAMEHVTLYGRAARRAPTAFFTVAGRTPRQVAEHLAARQVNVWNGDNYAWELAGALGLRDSGGAVRAGLVHYNDQADVDRLLAAVAELA